MLFVNFSLICVGPTVNCKAADQITSRRHKAFVDLQLCSIRTAWRRSADTLLYQSGQARPTHRL